MKPGDTVLRFRDGYPERYTVTDVTENYRGEEVVLVEEAEGYFYPSDLYTRQKILSYFDPE